MITLIILLRAVTISLIVTAVWFCCQPDEIFGRPAAAVDNWLLRFRDGHWYWIAKPIYRCSVCMCGIWTLVLYPALFGLDWWLLVSMLESIGMNALTLPIIKKITEE